MPDDEMTMDVAYPVFDERWYRETYADVDQAVRLGVYASGHDHYARYGRAEGRFPCADAEEDHRFGRGIYALTDAERQKRVSAVWSADAEQTPGWYWMAHPMVRTRLNVLASGDPATDAYGHFANLLRHRGVSLPIGRAVSLGCGFGGLERDLAARGIIAEIDAYDIAPGAIAEARRLAQEGGFTSLRYHVADLEHEPIEAGAVDVVFAHSSVHHVERLEELFASVNAMLKPGGLFHLYEFVGPTRFQWTDAQLDGINRFLERLTPRLRRLPSGRPRPLQTRPTIAAMNAVDPSEAIRSSDIIPMLGEYFDVVEVRVLGGALLHLGLADIAQNFDPDSPDDRAVLEAFFAEEDAGLRAGTIGSDFAVITVAKREAPTTRRDPEPDAVVATSSRMTAKLKIPAGFPLPGLIAALAPGDTMHDGRDDHYLAVGMSALRCIEDALKGKIPRSILDLPCGFGRVTRVLRARYPEAQITVSDLDRPGVDFAASQFGAIGVYSAEDLASLELGKTFDLIWVGSLVTHLSELQARALLQTLHRAMTNDGTLVISSHGPTIIAGLKTWLYGLEPASAAGVLDDYASYGYGHRGYGQSNGYGISLTDRHWWTTAAADHGFVLELYQERAWDGHQDVLALRKQANIGVGQSVSGPLSPPTDPAAIVRARQIASGYELRMSQFDTAYYLSANPDVAAAIAEGHFASAYHHYNMAGRREGRPYSAAKPTRTPVPSDSPFDEAWYLRTFPDVAAAVSRGECLSGYDHWLDMGRSEGRPPHG